MNAQSKIRAAALQPFALSPDETKRANAWITLLDEAIAFGTIFTPRLERYRRDLIANSTSDGLFSMWLGECAEGMRGELRSAEQRWECGNV